EIHIEQGPILEKAGNTIGLVEAAWGAKKYTVTVTGDQGHTGATPMPQRRDALYGAAKFIVAAREIVEKFPEDSLHTSVSTLELFPNSPVTYAGKVTINLDLRSPDRDVLKRAEELLTNERKKIERTAQVEISQCLTHQWDLLPYNPEGLKVAKQAALEL